MTVTVDFHVTGFLGHIKVSLTDWSGQHGEVKQHSQPGGQTCWAALTRLIFVTWVKQKARDQSWLWAWLNIQMDLWKPYRWQRNKGIFLCSKHCELWKDKWIWVCFVMHMKVKCVVYGSPIRKKKNSEATLTINKRWRLLLCISMVTVAPRQ